MAPWLWALPAVVAAALLAALALTTVPPGLVAGLAVASFLAAAPLLWLAGSRYGRASERWRAELIVRHAADAILTTNEQGQVESFNPAAEQLFGYTEAEVLGWPVERLLESPARRRKPATDRVPVGTVLGLAEGAREVLGRRKGGGTFPLELALSQAPSGRRRLAVALTRDISKRKQAQRQLTVYHAATQALAGADTPLAGAAGVLEAVCEGLELDLAEFWEADGSSGGLRRAAAYRAPAAAGAAPADAGPGHALAARCKSSRQPVGLGDPAEAGGRSGGAVPVLLGDAVIGVLTWFSRHPRRLDEQELRLLTTVSSQLGQSLERRRAEDALRTSEERYRLLFESHPQPTWVCDQATHAFLAVNEAAVEHYGYAREEFLGMTVEHLRPSGEGPPPAGAPAGAGGRAGGPALARHRRKDGTVIDVEVTAHDLSFGGRPARLVLACDVTERRRVEAARQRLIAILEATPDLVAISRVEGPASYVNAAGRRLLGLGPEDPVYLLDHRPASARAAILDGAVPAAIRDGVWSGETVLLGPSGEEIPVSQVLIAHKAPDGAVESLSTIARDIRAQKRLEAEYRQAQKLEAIGRLAGGVAHDFNNLIQIVTGYGELLLERLADDDPARVLVQEITDAGGRAAALTRQLLAFSRKAIVEPRVLNLVDVVADTERLLRRVIGEDIELVTRCDPGAGQVKADPGQLSQVLLNLAVNARDAMPTGGRLTLEVRDAGRDGPRAGSPATPYVLLAVSDTGQGIPAEVLPHVWEPFFSTKAPGQGTGLGLAVVQGVVEQAGGRTEVESRVGTGTTVKLYFPRVAGRTVAPPAPAGPAPMPGGAETVLVVEDEAEVRSLSAHILSTCGYSVLEARDGEHALEVAAAHAGRIDLLLTDVVMPGMGGRELAEQLAPLRPGMKVLYLSGYTDDAVVRHGVREHEVAFLQKPFGVADLARKVREVLDRRA